MLSDTHNDQRLFSKSSLSSLFFGKAETAMTTKSIGAEVKIEKRKKSSKSDPPESSKHSNISESLKKVYEKYPNLRKCAKKTVDGEHIPGVKSHSIVQEREAAEKAEYAKTEDWVLQRLFKRAGVVMDTAIDQQAVTDGVDYRKIDKEAQKVANRAVAALHKRSRNPGEKKKLKSKKAKSASILEKIRARRDAKAEAEQPLSVSTDLFKKSKLNPNYKLAQQLRDYIEDHWSGVTSEDIVSKFDGNVKSSAVFKV